MLKTAASTTQVPHVVTTPGTEGSAAGFTNPSLSPELNRYYQETPGYFSGAAATGPTTTTTYETVTTPETWEKTQTAFDTNFYDQRRQAYIDNYAPQLADQFSKARSDMAFALARAGLGRSSVAADQNARLQAANAVQSATIASQAESDVSSLRNRVEDQRANLVTQLNASADPGGTANLALARTQSLAAEPVTYNALGDVFTGFAQGIGKYIQGQQSQQYLTALGLNKPTVAATGNSRTQDVRPVN